MNRTKFPRRYFPSKADPRDSWNRQCKMEELSDPYLMENNKLPRVPPNFHIKISLTMIKYFGTWPPDNHNRIIYLLYSSLTFTFMLGIYLTVQFINLIIIWGDVPSMVATTFLLMTNSVHAYKIFLILGNQRRIQGIFDMLESDQFSKDSDKFERIFTWYAWQGMYHHLIYQSFGTMAVFCWGFTPIADAISGHARRLPMEAWYPYDTQATPAFQLTCAHQGLAVMLGCFHNVSMDTLITGLLNVACCQLEVIKKNLSGLDRPEGFSRDSGDSRLREEMLDSFEHSVRVMGFIDEVRDIFGNVVLAQLLVNCIIICLTAFHITQMTVFIPVEIFGMMTYMCCMTYQIFIYCWHGNELTLQSQSLSSAVFSGNWWKFNKKLNNDLGILITRSHKPIIFKAGPIMQLSLQTFVGILRLSYSFFTVLSKSTQLE